jgi:hypothetical protein
MQHHVIVVGLGEFFHELEEVEYKIAHQKKSVRKE